MIKGCMAVYPEHGTYKPDETAWTGHYTRWVKLLNSHPNITVDFVGLSDKKDFTFLAEYDFVYMYILPVDKVGDYWWYEMPVVAGKYCRKLILQFDYEGVMLDLPPFVRETINNNVDVLCYNSPIAGEKWNVDVPKFPLMIIQPVEELEKKVAKLRSNKKEGIGILWHAGTGCNIDLSLTVCGRLPYKTKVFTSWLGMRPEFLQKKCYQYGNNFECYPFLQYDDYLQELSKCKVVLEDNENYYGFSRLAYECATMFIPVVGSTNSMALNIAYPFTSTNPKNVQLQTQLLKRLMDDMEFRYRVVNYAYEAMKNFLSDQNCTEMFLKVLGELKLI